MKRLRALPSLPRLIVTVTAVLLAMGLGAAIAWRRTGNDAIISGFFHYPGALFLVGASAVQLWLSWLCWRQFSRGDLMCPAWFAIMLAGGAHSIGSICSQLLGVDSYLNPLMYCDVPWVDSAAESLRQLGLLLGGPCQMTLLASGLALMLRTYRRAGLAPRLTAVDWLLVAALISYTVREAWQVVWFMQHGKAPTSFEVISWASDPLLIVLLFEAVCIRRAVLSMGRGLIAKCWGAFAAAIALTALGDAGIWATWNRYLDWPVSAIGWYLWFLPAAAYALGPAYQVEAFRSVYGSVYPVRPLMTRRTAA